MKVLKTGLEGVLLIQPPTFFEDHRGRYVETYNREIYAEHGITQDFVQDDFATSSRHVLRGIHGDAHTWKLISVLHGKVYLVAICWDEVSPQYKKWEAFTLSEENGSQILLPPKFGSAHVVMSEKAIYHYKQTSYYDRKSQFTLKWNDPGLGIWWPVDHPITTPRDQGLK